MHDLLALGRAGTAAFPRNAARVIDGLNSVVRKRQWEGQNDIVDRAGPHGDATFRLVKVILRVDRTPEIFAKTEYWDPRLVLNEEIPFSLSPYALKDHKTAAVEYPDWKLDQAWPVLVARVEIIESNPHARGGPSTVLRKSQLPFTPQGKLTFSNILRQLLRMACVVNVTSKRSRQLRSPAEVTTEVWLVKGSFIVRQ